MSCRAIPILASLLLAWLSAGCQTNPEVSSPLRSDVTEIIGEDKNFVVVRAGATESYEALATRYYADPAKAWLLREENGSQRLTPGQFVVVPRSEQNAIGVRHDSYQVVPILSYHHFGARRGRLSVTAEQFTEQLDYLRRNGYTVARLSDFHAFLEGRRRLPRKSVVITIDDGYRSVYDVAFPILREYNVPATVFIYSDFIGKGGLTKKQMAQMEASGLVDMQAHSKTHANLTETVVGESPADYRARVQAEVRTPKSLLEKTLRKPVLSMAYPYGAVNRVVAKQLEANGVRWGFTVKRGSNPFFGYAFGLNRTMVYRSTNIEGFAEAVRVSANY